MVARKYLPYYFSFVSLMWEWHPCHEFSRHHPIYREKHHTGMVDVYVIAHGWNFTLEESIGLYENYRLSAENFVESFKSTNPNDESFEPYFIFVSWTSVTRPLTDGFRSISPFGIPSPLKEILGFTDVVTFHIFSNWGETVSAYEIALGNAERMQYSPEYYTPGGEYDKEIKKIRNKIKNSKFEGYDIPASAIIDKLIQLREPGTKQGLKIFYLHTIGHSFGAKLISLASLDACARVHWKENKEKKEHKSYIDSMILFNPAMNIAEMYEPVETPQKEREYLIEKVLDAPRDVIRYFSSVSPEEGDSNRFELVATTIKRKAIVFNRHDSATGWMFSLSQFLLNYDTFPTQNAKKIWRQGGFFGSLDVPKFVMKFGISFVQTAVIDANVLVFRTVDSLAAPFVGEKEKFSKKQLRLFLLPFSLFLYQRGIGNRGFKDIGFFSRSTSLRNRWLTEKALKFINNKSDDNDCSLEKLSFKALSGNKIDSNKCANAKCHKKGYYLYDAHEQFNGHRTHKLFKYLGALSNRIPPGAHGDLRLYDITEDDKRSGLRKRHRTFNFIHNFTRISPDTKSMSSGQGARGKGQGASLQGNIYQ